MLNIYYIIEQKIQGVLLLLKEKIVELDNVTIKINFSKLFNRNLDQYSDFFIRKRSYHKYLGDLNKTIEEYIEEKECIICNFFRMCSRKFSNLYSYINTISFSLSIKCRRSISICGKVYGCICNNSNSTCNSRGNNFSCYI